MLHHPKTSLHSQQTSLGSSGTTVFAIIHCCGNFFNGRLGPPSMDNIWTSRGGVGPGQSSRVAIWLAPPKGDSLEYVQRPPVLNDSLLRPEAACRSPEGRCEERGSSSLLFHYIAQQHYSKIILRTIKRAFSNIKSSSEF